MLKQHKPSEIGRVRRIVAQCVDSSVQRRQYRRIRRSRYHSNPEAELTVDFQVNDRDEMQVVYCVRRPGALFAILARTDSAGGSARHKDCERKAEEDSPATRRIQLHNILM